MAKRKKDNEEEDQNNLNQSDDSADNFGLPDIDYKPLDRETPEPVKEQPEPEPRKETPVYNEEHETESPVYEEEEESGSRAPVIIGVVIALLVLVGGFALWKYVYVPRQQAKIELAKKLEADRIKKENDERLAKEAAAAEQKRLADEAAAKAKPAEGTIQALSGATNRFYIVLASDIDDDLIMDFAKRLSTKGVSTKIVPPFGATKFFRLAMGDYDSYASAQSGADAAKGDFGPNLWVLRY